MIIYAKFGSLPAGYVGLVRKHKAPIVGEVFKVYERVDARGRHERYQRSSGVRCVEIRNVGQILYILERF